MPTSSPLLSFEFLNQTVYLALPFTGLIYAENGPTVLTCSTARKIQLWSVEGGKEVWGGFTNEGREEKEGRKKAPSTIKNNLFLLCLIRTAFRLRVKQFPPWISPPPRNCFHRKRILGRFQCAPRGRTMRPLKLGILASFCYPGAGERAYAEGTRGPTPGPSGGGPGLQGDAEPPGGSPAAKSQVGIRRWSRGAQYPVPNVYPAPRLGAGKGGGDEDPITAAPAGSPGGGGGKGTQSLGQAGLGC